MINFTKIIENKSEVLIARITPNVIYNRFDILYGSDYDLWDLGEIVVQVKQIGDTLHLGLYLVKADEQVLRNFINFLFNQYGGIKYIEIKHCYVNLCGAEPYPYWHIDLPETKERLFNKLVNSNL